MVAIGIFECFGRDGVGVPLPLRVYRGLKPPLLDPKMNLGLSNTQRSSKTLDREEIAADLANTETVPLQHAADRLCRAIQFPRDLFDRALHEFFAHYFNLFLGPAPVVHFSFDPVLNDEAPTCFARTSGVALQPNHQLLK